MKIAIASGKGGTGKTTVSVNLSALMHEQGLDVQLVDLDVEEPNSKLFLGREVSNSKTQYLERPIWKKDNCTACGKCEYVCNFNAIIQLGSEIQVFSELCKSCFACSELCPTNSLEMKPNRIGVINEFDNGSFNFIEGLLDIGQESATPLIGMTKNFAESKSTAITLFDSPPGASCPAIEACKHSDLVILVTEPTPFGLNDLSIAYETIQELNIETKVIINRFGIGDDGVEIYCKKNAIEIIARIPNSKDIAELYSEGELIYSKHEGFKNELEKVAKYIKEKLK